MANYHNPTEFIKTHRPGSSNQIITPPPPTTAAPITIPTTERSAEPDNKYIHQFLQNIEENGEPFNDATSYGIEITEAAVAEGETYWKVIGIHHLTGNENKGNHHLYLDVLDEDGNRVYKARVVMTQDASNPVYTVIDRPLNEDGALLPMWSNTRGTVSVLWPEGAPLPSDSVGILRSDWPDEDPGNTWGHHSFLVVFQRTQKSDGNVDVQSAEGERINIIEWSPNVSIVDLNLTLNARSAEDVKQTFRDLKEQEVTQVIVDLEDVAFIDSSGLAALVSGLKTFDGEATNLKLAAPQSQARLLFELTMFDRVFEIYDSVEDATSSLNGN